MPTLAQVLVDKATVWTTLSLVWYDGHQRQMEVTSAKAVWFHMGKPVVPVRWVVVCDPIALLSTDSTTNPVSIVTWFVQR